MACVAGHEGGAGHGKKTATTLELEARFCRVGVHFASLGHRTRWLCPCAYSDANPDTHVDCYGNTESNTDDNTNGRTSGNSDDDHNAYPHPEAGRDAEANANHCPDCYDDTNSNSPVHGNSDIEGHRNAYSNS